jgi:hypothetical protein
MKIERREDRDFVSGVSAMARLLPVGTFNGRLGIWLKLLGMRPETGSLKQKPYAQKLPEVTRRDIMFPEASWSPDIIHRTCHVSCQLTPLQTYAFV